MGGGGGASVAGMLRRLCVSLALAALAGWLCWRTVGPTGGDFGFAVRAARHLISGVNPYDAMVVTAKYGEGGPLLYPLPVVFAGLPFAWMELKAASALFIALSTFWLAFALWQTRGVLALSALLSPPMLWSVLTAQWPPLMLAAALTAGAGWFGAMKPNLGLIGWLYRPDRVTIVGGVILCALSLYLVPTWPFDWWRHLHAQPVAHLPALMWPLGAVGLLGLLRWRTPEGRVLAALTVVPLSATPYDWLLLWLVARTGRECLTLTVITWSAWLAMLATAPHNLVRAWTAGHLLLSLGWLLPALLITLRRPNEAVAALDPAGRARDGGDQRGDVALARHGAL